MIEKRFDQQITFIYVQDLAISQSFYENLLGLDLILDQGACRIVKTSGDAYLGYCFSPGRERGEDGVLITLVTPYVDEWYEYLLENEVVLLDPPKLNTEYGIYHFFFLDPDGYKIEIQHFTDENWNSQLF
jgi:catechol 2,3-dioxygenase-like lactoylglutathione lyase family enzyme